MTNERATVQDGVLRPRRDGRGGELAVGGEAWTRWLDDPATTAFRVEHATASFTARKQFQRGRPYWYAYRRVGGRLRKTYLGRAADLTPEALAAAGARLAGAASESTPRGAREPARATAGERHNLPSEPSSFLGRAAEIASARQALAAARLVTLTGPGGVGKTRLALQTAAAALDDTADAVWLVDLGGLTDPALVPQAVAQAIGMREESGQAPLATLAVALRGGRVLLVLDNCEHLVDACAAVVAAVVRACPDLRVLATSREPLGVPGEVVRVVPPLSLPDEAEDGAAEPGRRSDAEALFVERAEAAQPGLVLDCRSAAAVAEICRRLDGIPLAIELAAARTRALAPEEIAVRLDDRFALLAGGSRTAPPRQRTLRAAVDWSYDLLAPAERRCFERLSVFADGAPFDGAEAVCVGDEVVPEAVLDLLAGLVDRSLVVAERDAEAGTTRYRMLETLRAYGAERLAARGDAEAVRTRHAAWIAARARQAGAAFRGPEQGRWLRWAEREHDNVRTALGWALARGDAATASDIVAALAWSWLAHARWSEGLGWVERTLALLGPAPTRDRGMLLLNGAVPLSLFRGDLTAGRPDGDPAPTLDWLVECLAIGERCDDDELILGSIGFIQLLREFGVHVPRAPETRLEDDLVRCRQVGHAWGERRTLEALARQAFRQGRPDEAAARFRQAIDLARRDEDGWSLAMALNALGDVERARGRHLRARSQYEESLAVFAGIGLGDQPGLTRSLGYVALALNEPADAAARFRHALARFRRHGERRGMAECLFGYAAVAAAQGRAVEAARWFGAGDAALAALATLLSPADRSDVERWRARAAATRSRAAFERSLAEGRTLSLEAAVAALLDGGALAPAPASDPPDPAASLTRRERDVANYAAWGMTNRQIADALGIAEKTAANHLQHALEKLDVRSRVQLAARAAEFGLQAAQPGLADAE